METNWPGDPTTAWDAASGSAHDLWVPGSHDLPPFDTPEDVLRNYALNTPWWARALLGTLIAVLLAATIWSALTWVDWDSFGWFRLTVLALATALIVAACAWGLYRFIASEIRWHRERPLLAHMAATTLTANPMGIWGLFVGVVRLKDRVSGDDTPDDIVFLFDMRVPHAVLQRQRAAATAWIETIAAAEPKTNMPSALSEAFAGRRSVHCAEVFGEPMRGVWMVRKGSVLPFETLGLATIDPRTADDFSSDDVVFLRATPRQLRHRSRIGKV